MTNKFFYICCIISLLLHIATIQIFLSRKAAFKKKSTEPMEVVYKKINPSQLQKAKSEPAQAVKVLKNKMETPLKGVDILTKKDSLKSTISQEPFDVSKFSGKLHSEKKQAPKILLSDHGPKITIPLLKTEKITNPQYLNYNDRIRQKIRQRAYQYANDPDFQKGEVYLTFVLESNGDLKETKIVNNKTFANDYLRRVGLKSIEESSPYPPFPKDFNYPELTFNVVISFELTK